MSRLLSAIILGGSLVIGAFLMRLPRYEEFPVDNSADRVVHGVFDRRTGEICFRDFVLNVNTYNTVELLRPDVAREDDAGCPLPSD